MVKNPDTDFLAGGAAKGANTLEKDTNIGYNWPYDFFSLVEMVQIEEDIVFGTPVAVTIDKDFDPSAMTPEGVTATKKTAKTVVEQIADQATSGFTNEGVQNTLGTVATETTKTVASQIDPNKQSQYVRTAVISKEQTFTETVPSDTTNMVPVVSETTKTKNTSIEKVTEEVIITEMEPAPISPTTPPVKQDLSGPLAADNTMQPVAESKSTFTKPAVNQSTSNQQVSSKTIQPMTKTKKRKKRKKNNFKKLK